MLNVLGIINTDILDVLLVIIFICIALYFATIFIHIIGKIFLFKKANQPLASAFIPIYDKYILCKLSGTNLMWLFVFYGSFVLGIIEDDLFWIFGLAALAFRIVMSLGISKSFGKGFGTAVLLFIFEPIFYIVLGISGNYIGPVGCNDPIFGRFSYGNTKKDDNAYKYDVNAISEKIKFPNENKKYSFCPGCGFRLSDGDKFCPGCGREL